MNILVVDDEDFIREMITEMLESKYPDYKLFSASDGQSALDLLEHQSMDIIFTDLHMPPGMNGEELISNLESKDFKGKIVIISGFYGNEEIKSTLRSATVLISPLSLKV